MLARSGFARGFIAGLLVCSVLAFGWREWTYWMTIDGVPNYEGPRTLDGWAAWLHAEAVEGATPALVCFGHAKGFRQDGPYHEHSPRQHGGWDVNGWFSLEDLLRQNMPPHAS